MRTNKHRHTASMTPTLPVGARAILPTIWSTFITTVVLALTFSFGNVWDLGRTIGVERHVAPLIGPAVDITAIGLLIAVPWLVLAGANTRQLRSANALMAISGLLTLALNSAPSAIRGATTGDPRAWGRAVVEAIVPVLLIAWSHVGPKLIGVFVEIRTQHAVTVKATLRDRQREASEEAAGRRAEVASAVAAVRAEMASAEAEFRQAAASVEATLRAQLEALRDASVEAPRTSTAKPNRKRVEAPRVAPQRTPRKAKEELLAERVEAAKDALPTWQLETPSGPEVASALGLKSEGVISDIRKKLTADRLALAAHTDRGSQS